MTLVSRVGCGCDCHIMPGVKHVTACCDEPPFGFGQPTPTPSDEEAVKVVADALDAENYCIGEPDFSMREKPEDGWEGNKDVARIAVAALRRAGFLNRNLLVRDVSVVVDQLDSARSLVRGLEEAYKACDEFIGDGAAIRAVHDALAAVAQARKDGAW